METITKGILWAVVLSPLNIEKRYPCGLPHHVTLQYGADYEDCKHLIGRNIIVKAIALCHNERVEALFVKLPDWLPCQNDHPHITVSWIEGAEPVEANEMLAVNPECKVLALPPIECIIGFQEWTEPCQN